MAKGSTRKRAKSTGGIHRNQTKKVNSGKLNLDPKSLKRHSTGSMGIISGDKERVMEKKIPNEMTKVQLNVESMMNNMKSDMEQLLKATISDVKKNNDLKAQTIQQNYSEKKERLEILWKEKAGTHLSSITEEEFNKEKENIMAISQSIRNSQKKASSILRQTDSTLKGMLASIIKAQASMIKKEVGM